MNHVSRWHRLSIALVVIGAAAASLAAVINRDQLGSWQWAVFAGATLSVIGAFGFRRKLSVAEQEVERARSELHDRQAELATEEQRLTIVQADLETALGEQSKQLDRREKALAGRLVAFREWMEFPAPVDLQTEHPGDDELRELAEMDRRMFELLTEQTEVLFDNIKQNKYVVDGRLQTQLIRDDLYELATQVARIYRGDTEDPLLETSLTQVLTALSRACLHFQVVLEDLPVNVKDYSLKSLYSYVRTAVKAYGVYKSAEPFLSFANHAFYLTRVAMGGSPLTLGAYWFLSVVGKEGTKALTNRIVNRQALALLHNLVRVIGCEVAGIYGGDFRHRDPNWIYAVELVEVVHRLPNTRESLAAAMQEVGVLQFRNEYDRVFVYRCLAAGKTINADAYRADIVLNNEERQAVATRLERFLATHFSNVVVGHTFEEWHADLEQRLNLRIDVSPSNSATVSTEQEVDEAIRSLASFLLGVKQLELEQLDELLPSGHLFSSLTTERRQQLLAELRDNPPYFFEHPNVNARSVVADQFLEDLAELDVRSTPRDARVETMLDNVAAYLRRASTDMQEILKRRFQNRLIDLIPDLPTPRDLELNVVRAILDLLDHAGRPLFLYGNVTVKSADDVVRNNAWLLGTVEELFLIQSEPTVEVLWKGTANDSACECSRQYLQRSCRLNGGKWFTDFPDPEILLVGSWFSSLEASFQPLIEYYQPSAAS